MAYGCSGYKTGCDFKVTFEEVRKQLGKQKASKELVYEILRKSVK
jgi:DNA topoisomerase-3